MEPILIEVEHVHEIQTRQDIDQFVDLIMRTPFWLVSDSYQTTLDKLPLELVDYFWDALHAKREAMKQQLVEARPTSEA